MGHEVRRQFLYRSRGQSTGSFELLIPKVMPRMGDTVLVRKPPNAANHPLGPWVEEKNILSNEDRTQELLASWWHGMGRPRSELSECQGEGRRDCQVEASERPMRSSDSSGGQSTHQNIRWDAPLSDMITVEEPVGEVQPWNDGNTASEIIRERLKKHLDSWCLQD